MDSFFDVITMLLTSYHSVLSFLGFLSGLIVNKFALLEYICLFEVYPTDR